MYVMMMKEEYNYRGTHEEAIRASSPKKAYDDENLYTGTIIDDEIKEEFTNMLRDVTKKEHQSFISKKNSKVKGFKAIEKLSESAGEFRMVPGLLSNGQFSSPEKGKNVEEMIKVSRRLMDSIIKVRTIEWRNSKLYSRRIGKTGDLAKMINPKWRSGPITNNTFPTKPGEAIQYAVTQEERKAATINTHLNWTKNSPGKSNFHFLETVCDEVGPTGIKINPEKMFKDIDFITYCNDPGKIDKEMKQKIIKAHRSIKPFIESITSKQQTMVYPFTYNKESRIFESNIPRLELEKCLVKGMGKARAENFSVSVAVFGRFPPIFAEIYLLKLYLHLSLRIIDRETERSLRVCIPKADEGVRPITVAHDDNCFMNMLVQKAFQSQVDKRLPRYLSSFRKGRGCQDATLVDGVVRELALQYGDGYVGIIEDDLEKMYDRIYIELQA